MYVVTPAGQFFGAFGCLLGVAVLAMPTTVLYLEVHAPLDDRLAACMHAFLDTHICIHAGARDGVFKSL